MKTILRPDRFLLRSCDDLQVLTAFSLRSPIFSSTWLDVVRTWPSVKGVSSLNALIQFMRGNITQIVDELCTKNIVTSLKT
jgi:hypothetical protein